MSEHTERKEKKRKIKKKEKIVNNIKPATHESVDRECEWK